MAERTHDLASVTYSLIILTGTWSTSENFRCTWSDFLPQSVFQLPVQPWFNLRNPENSSKFPRRESSLQQKGTICFENVSKCKQTRWRINHRGLKQWK